ncbi:MAG: helix-turn-helix domain-containing protein [Cyanobacteria bacterium P01_C01_bin.118]
MTSYSNVQKQQLSQLGAYLQEKRQAQGKSIEDIALQTYIRAQLLKAVEAGDPTDLPQPIFVQGFIRRYADALGLDGTNFAKQFPVHSIPNTPRPVPRPAIQVDMSYQTPKKPVTEAAPQAQPKSFPSVSKPEPLKQPEPAVGAMPVVNAESMATPTPAAAPAPAPAQVRNNERAAEKTNATNSFTLDSKPMTDGELTALGLSTLADSADRANSPDGSLLGKEEIVPPSLGAATPTPRPIGSTLGSMDNEPKSGVNWLPLGIGAAVAAGAIALLIPIVFNGNSGNNATTPIEAEAPIEQVEVAETEAAAPDLEPPVEAAPEPPAATASDAPVNLVVEITEAGPSWMSINVDGAIVFEGLMEPGTKETWEGQKSITMNVGNAGAAIVSANGSEPKPAGNPGGAEFLTFTADE